MAKESVNLLRISAPAWRPFKKGETGSVKGETKSAKFLAGHGQRGVVLTRSAARGPQKKISRGLRIERNRVYFSEDGAEVKSCGQRTPFFPLCQQRPDHAKLVYNAHLQVVI